jgi:hypothetical protein
MKKLSVILLALMLILAVGLVSAGPNDLPGNGWTSGQQIQNVGGASGTVNLMAYDQAGGSFNCGDQALDPGESYTYLPATDCATMPAGFEGSAVASADQPIAAVVNVNNKPVGAAAGQYTGTDGSAVATSVVFPLVKSNHSGRTTTFYIQNASNSTNNITASFKVNGVTYTKTYNAVPANAMVIVNPADTTNPGPVPTGTGQVGALTVTGTQPIAGTSLEHQTSPSVAANLQASRGFVPTDFGSTLYCPLVRYAFGSKLTTTGLQVQNVGNVPTDITVTYSVVVGTAVNTTTTQTNIAAGASANFLQATDLNAGALAAATITSTSTDIAAIVNDKATASNPERVTTYSCFSDSNATDTISLPLVKEVFNGNSTGVQVQNVGNSSTNVTLTYITNNAQTVVIETSSPIAAGASKTFVNLTTGGTSGINVVSGSLATLAGTVNGVTVVSGGQPIVAIANESAMASNANPQDTKNYEGFNK